MMCAVKRLGGVGGGLARVTLQGRQLHRRRRLYRRCCSSSGPPPQTSTCQFHASSTPSFSLPPPSPSSPAACPTTNNAHWHKMHAHLYAPRTILSRPWLGVAASTVPLRFVDRRMMGGVGVGRDYRCCGGRLQTAQGTLVVVVLLLLLLLSTPL